MRILISGMVAGDPDQGGASWAVLQYVLGFQRLGHEVLLVEPVETLEAASVTQFQAIATRFGLERRAAIVAARNTVGLSYDRLRRLAKRVDLLINISGILRDETLIGAIPIRVFLDLDPAFNQLWHAVEGIDVGFSGHTHYATVGSSLANGDCGVPSCGYGWIPTLPPVVLEQWPVADRVVYDAWTTVGNWRAYGSIEYGDVHYGQKAHSLRQLVELPTRINERFILALNIHAGEERDLKLLAANRWELLDPRDVAGTPTAYARFVRGSKGELGVAKSGYVVSRCGWFSDRSACYLASGRPVIAQDTGFGEFLPAGAGLLSFSTTDEAQTAIEAVGCDYPRHARAARAIAEEYLDSDRVLTDLLRAVGALPPARRKRALDAADGAIVEALKPLEVSGLRRRPFACRSSYPLVALELTDAHGSEHRVLLKELSRTALTDRARRSKPEFLHDPLREIETYLHLLEGAELGTPACYGTSVIPSGDRYWLLIEQVSGVELYQVGELDTWKEVARWLARLHDRFTGAPLNAHVLQYDEQFLSLWFERARAFGRAVGIRGYELVVDRLIRLPRTLVHGELYASNVLIAGDRVCVVDWETAGAGPGVIDLATLTTGWQEAQAAELAAAYREALRDPPDPAQFAVDLDFARLHLAVRWLGWSPEWSPPPEHARDWHADALELQARLGLCGETT